MENVAYKTVEEVCDGVVSGPIYHATFKIPFGGFVEMKPIGCDCVKESDVANYSRPALKAKRISCSTKQSAGQKVYNCLLGCC